MIEVMSETKVRWESVNLLELKLGSYYGEIVYLSTVNVKQPDIIESVTKGLLSSNGSESEASKIMRNWKNLESEAKLWDSKKILLELYKTSSDQLELCLMIGLYLSQDLELLRAPHAVFNHFVKVILFSTNRWTKQEEQTLLDNLAESDKVLQQKIPSKNLKQIKDKKRRIQENHKAEIKNQPISLEEDVQIALFVLGGKMPKSLEEFHEITKQRQSWIELSKSMKRTPSSVARRFYHYIKPFIEADCLNIDLEEEIVIFNQYLVEQKIPSVDKIDWNLFPLSKPFYTFNKNLDSEDWKRKDEPLWSVVKDRNERGVKLCRILPEDHRKAILKALAQTELEKQME